LFPRDAFLVALTLTALGGVSANGFVNYDDITYVVENVEVLNGFSVDNVTWAFTTRKAANWHPLTWLSLQLDSTIFGTTADVYHRTNLLLHLASVLVLAEVLRRMTGAIWRSAMVAALFAVHPLHVESVAWVSERKDVLSTLFGLLALAAYVGYARRQRLGWMGLVLLGYACSLMAKPMLVTLPFLLLLLDYWPLRRAGQAGKSDLRGPWWLVVEKVPLFLLAAGSCLMTLQSQAEGGAIEALDRLPLAVRLANAIHATVCYLGQMFYPVNLAIYYPYPRAGLPWLQVLAEGLMLVAITGAVCWLARSRPYLPVGWFWYLGTLVPVIGLVQVGGQAHADRYTYVPLIGIFLMLVWGVHDLIPEKKGLLIGVSAAVLLGCVLLTRAQVRHWFDSLHLWEHAVKVTTANGRAHANYSLVLYRHDPEAALLQIQESIRVEPGHPVAHHIEGGIYEALKRWDEAEASYQAALALWPDNTSYQNVLLDLQAKRRARVPPPQDDHRQPIP